MLIPKRVRIDRSLFWRMASMAMRNPSRIVLLTWENFAIIRTSKRQLDLVVLPGRRVSIRIPPQ